TTLTRTPRPQRVGTAIVPPFWSTNGGSTMSSAQYRSLAEMSPGSRKFGRVARATLQARPIPVSSMPPHHTGTPPFAAMSWIRRDSANPPTRPGLMLITWQAPSCRAWRASRADLLQQVIGGGLDADADAGLHPIPNAAQKFRQRFAGALGQRGGEGHLEASFRHVVTANRREQRFQRVDVGELAADHGRQQIA